MIFVSPEFWKLTDVLNHQTVVTAQDSMNMQRMGASSQHLLTAPTSWQVGVHADEFRHNLEVV